MSNVKSLMIAANLKTNVQLLKLLVKTIHNSVLMLLHSGILKCFWSDEDWEFWVYDWGVVEWTDEDWENWMSMWESFDGAEERFHKK